jgi:hypothetical protein
MESLQPNTARLPPALRALALSLLIETGAPLLNGSHAESPEPPSQGELWQALRCKCGELSALVLRAEDPGEAIAFVLGYLPKHFQYAFALCGRKQPPALADFEAGLQSAWQEGRADA